MRRFSLVVLAALAVASCAKTGISGRVEGADSLSVRLINGSCYNIIDTIVTDGGEFDYNLKTEESPEFVYLFYKNTKVASLLLSKGEKAVVSADTLGNWTVSGSPESEKLRGVEMDFSAFVRRVSASESVKEYTGAYVDFYRQSLKYVLSNPYSLTVVPVLYAKIGENAPVFSQTTDALIFRGAVDSLKTVYPDSKYVKALERETVLRERQLNLDYRISNAREMGFPDLEMSDINGKMVRLSDVRSKVVLLHFWTPADNLQSMFNIEVLKGLYKDYHSKGLEIYSVGIDSDKIRWAGCVKAQELPWINVCDGRGTACPALGVYNVGSLPCSVLIADDSVSSVQIAGEKDLRRELNRILRK